MSRFLRLALALSGAALVLGAIAAPMTNGGGGASAAIGGPVILGGDDLTDHGGVDIDGNPLAGWLYMQRALENIEPNVTRSNDGSIAALGSAEDGGNAGEAIAVAASKVGMTVTYYDGGPAIADFFSELSKGNVDPAIIWVAGNGAGNDIDEQEEIDALIAGAGQINSFVNSGGGLMSHGTEYSWLQALLPDSTTVNNGSEDDLYFTPEGLVALPALTDSDINAGPWHNYFEGDLGGLDVLVRSESRQANCGEQTVEAQIVQECEDAPVVIGGARVSITEEVDDNNDPTATPTSCIPPLIGYRCDGNPGSGTVSTPVPPSPVATVAGATVVPAATATRVSQPLGIIRAPDTGDGSGTLGGSTPLATLIIVGLAGMAMIALGAKDFRRSR